MPCCHYAHDAVILFVSYSGLYGGAERLLADYAATLPAAAGLACPPGPLADAAAAGGVPVLPIAARALELRGGLRVRLRAAGDLVAHAAEIRRLARDLEPELVVAWGMRSAMAAMLAGVDYVFAHNDLAPGPVVRWGVRTAARRARRVITLSAAIAAELPPGAVVLHPGIDVDAFPAPDQSAGADPAESKAGADPAEVLVLGALVAWKRPDLALEAVARARRRLPGLRLRLVGAPLTGETDLLERLRTRAAAPDLAGAVELAGPAPDPRPALARAACLLHCAPREPFGLAVLEALAAGRPAVVPAAAGPLEIVDESCGRLYAPGDADAAAHALIDVLSDPARAATLGRAGRRRARRDFDLATARARFGALVAGVARPSRAGAPGAAGDALTVVTVTRNSAADLARLLDSVNRWLPGVAVVVVDCASEDDSVAVARSRPGVRVLEAGENLGYGRGCNLGLAEVATPVTALLNPDVVLLDDSLLALAGEALRAGAPERLLAPRVLNGDGSLQDTVHPLPGSAADLVRALIPPAAVPGPAGVALAPWRARRPRRVGWAVGCALVAPTTTLRGLGPFTPSLFLYGEDLELGLHARDRGIETWLWPQARVVHRRAHSTEREFGGEAFDRLARGRHDAVRLRRGPARAGLDDATQALTFASRLALKRALGRPAARERRQLAAVAGLRRQRWG